MIDGGSTDDTRTIAQEHGARIIEQRPQEEQGTPLVNFAEARNRGLQAASKNWILALDSDEYASEELMEELRNLTQTGAPCACWIPRKYITTANRIVTHATTYPNARLYFFHKDVVTEWVKPVHEKPELQPGTPIHELKGASMAPLGSREEYKQKNLRYLQIEVESDGNSSWLHWFLHRVLHTLRSRSVAFVKLLWIWLLPHKNCVRLPLNHELLRFWYGWKLIVATCPLTRRSHENTH